MTDDKKTIPSVSVSYARNGSSTKANALGMRRMQERAYERRGEQYLLIKSPPASGKSRALMFIALDKLANQGLKQAIIVVPEKSIGASFHDEPLTKHGFWADWTVAPKWNLCDAPGSDNGGKVNSLGAFLDSDDKVLVCTHATFRFAVDKFGVEKFDDRLIAVDEFHHVSADPESKLGQHLGAFIARDKVHIVAMTGSYFRGDAVPVLGPQDEAKFDTVTYTYYEQLNGYEYLKQLEIGYFFYSGSYIRKDRADDKTIFDVLDADEKTIVHIPNVNARESTKDKIKEVEEIIGGLGTWEGIDPSTGFQMVKTPSGKMVRIADLVDDDPNKRERVSQALKDTAQKNNRDHVDIIIALGMAKEGFDWIWCEHALTVGYRSSLTEIVQIIGRATRDAPGKTRARFTNLIAEPDASEEAVTEAINDTLKAIAASLLMEQVLAPRFNFTPKNPQSGPVEGFDYGEDGYDASKGNVGFNEQTGQFHIEIKGLAEPKSKEAARICTEDLNEVIAAFVQDKSTIERGLFDEELIPEELTVARMGKIIKDKYPELDEEDQEAVRQHAIAALSITQQAKQIALGGDGVGGGGGEAERSANTALIDGVRKYALSVTELDIDLIDRINPFGEAYAILAKTMNEETLKQVAAAIAAKRTSLRRRRPKSLPSARRGSRRSAAGCPPSTPKTPGRNAWPRGLLRLCASRRRAAMTDDLDLDELAADLADFAPQDKKGGRSAREERIIAGFEEIQRFAETHGRAPAHGEANDIFERLYAVRLDRLRGLEECRSLLAPLDKQGLLVGAARPDAEPVESIDDDELFAELEGVGGESDITELRHVRTAADKRAAEEIANRTRCEDFDSFKPLFAQVKKDLDAGIRQTRPFQTMAEIKEREFFIVGGQIAYVAGVGKEFVTEYDRRDSRLRVIYDNGTESDVLLRSLQRALHRDEAGRRITDPAAGPLFSGESEDGDLASGTIYVLRSRSDHPTVAAHRDVLHKIGVTGGTVEARIGDAKNDATFLLADVEIVATYKLSNINRTKLENLIHRIFDPARLDIEIKDRFGHPVIPREWFLAPLFVINEAVDRIRDGTITDYLYDPRTAALVREEKNKGGGHRERDQPRKT